MNFGFQLTRASSSSPIIFGITTTTALTTESSRPSLNGIIFNGYCFCLNPTPRFQQSDTAQWSATQIVAAIALAICVFVAFQTGIGPHLFIFFAPLGLCSIAISYFRRYTRGTEPYDKYLVPFASIRDLRIAYTAAPSFRKTQYPKQLAARRVRSPMFSALIAALRYVMWAVLAPIPLLAQCYPTTFTFPRVKHGVAQK